MDASHEKPELKLSFDPLTIEHLGFKMYSRLPNAVAELVANSYDADATDVRVVVDSAGTQSVRVSDDGHRMSPEDVRDKYLRIGRNRRADGSNRSESGRRKVAGRKGLGKLALFGIGERITLRTKRAGAASWTVVIMDWDGLHKATGGDYFPDTTTEPASDAGAHGTEILVEDLKRKTAVDAADLAASLAQLFNYIDDRFAVSVAAVGGEPINVTRDLRYGAIQKESHWKVPDEVPNAGDAPPITGVVIAAKKPLRQELRGLTVYVKGRLANDPEFFGVPESSYAYSYITGYIEADYLDDHDEDVVATDRRSINWESPEAAALRDYLGKVLREVATLRRETRRRAKQMALLDELDVDVEKWASTIENLAAANSVRQVLGVAVSPDTELSNDDRAALIDGLKGIAPEYADLHWRSLHPNVQAAAGEQYKGGHYFYALLDAIKRHGKDVRDAAGVDAVDLNALQAAFGGNPPRLDVASKFGEGKVTGETTENIRHAQRVISEGLWRGFRSPIAHEDIGGLRDHEVFSYQDCLDALSILSHLRRRLDGASAAGSSTGTDT